MIKHKQKARNADSKQRKMLFDPEGLDFLKPREMTSNPTPKLPFIKH